MVATMLGTRPATTHMALSTDRIIEGDIEKVAAGLEGDSGTYRAMKNSQLLRECLDLLNRGGVAALVPTSASGSYLDAIATQVEHFVRTRTGLTGPGAGGILALPTSGSTGSPKLVAIPAAGIAKFLGWGEDYFGFDASTVSLSLSPWNFDVSLLDTWAVLAAGGTVVAVDSVRLHDANYVAGLLRQYEPTFVQVVPSTLDALVKAACDDVCGAVRDVVLTGGVASRASRAAAARLFPGAVFHNVYGATEVNDCLIATLSSQQFADFEVLPLGMPIAGCEIVLCADDSVRPIAPFAEDGAGELMVRTPWMALGYITDGELQPLPRTTLDGYGALYAMKDRATLSDGGLEYLGRSDRTIKLRGQRINLDEIEQAARQTGLTAMTCAWVDESTGAQQLHLAYTAPDHASPPAPGLQLRLLMSRDLPAFAMPNHLHPFDRPFPLNGNGKPDLSAIKTLVESE
jgi:acyl-coenzyme A synthetase/AMP-(fatty) acid ligase